VKCGSTLYIVYCSLGHWVVFISYYHRYYYRLHRRYLILSWTGPGDVLKRSKSFKKGLGGAGAGVGVGTKRSAWE
jgi:hypothetical protein